MADKGARVDAQVARINGWLEPGLHLDPDRVKEIAKERQYDPVFFPP
jgi:hypothetical protein